MKLSLRLKLFLGFITLNFVVSSLLGYFMYQSSSERFFENFRDHKLSIARFISTAIDGDVHEKLTTPESSKDPHFLVYIRLLNTIWKQEKEVQYIYTLNYRPGKGPVCFTCLTARSRNRTSCGSKRPPSRSIISSTKTAA